MIKLKQCKKNSQQDCFGKKVDCFEKKEYCLRKKVDGLRKEVIWLEGKNSKLRIGGNLKRQPANG